VRPNVKARSERSAVMTKAARMQRRVDDLIERERTLADDGLRKLQASADRMLPWNATGPRDAPERPLASVAEIGKREAAGEVTRAAARMGRQLSDLVDLARIESGTLRIVKAPRDVGTLLVAIRQSYGPLLAKRAVSFTVVAPFPAIVASFDHGRIVQVLSNLIGHAIKFTAPGGRVGLHVERQWQQVQFVLRDNGRGIPPEALPHLFERFSRSDGDVRRGLGLGLYICQRIVEAHGGRIWVESEFGTGTTFRFTLPAH
jgi:signal transduction histidine kinase